MVFGEFEEKGERCGNDNLREWDGGGMEGINGVGCGKSSWEGLRGVQKVCEKDVFR